MPGRVVKIERFTKEVRKAILGPVLSMKMVKLVTGMVSEETLRTFAEGLASEHRPIRFDYEAKFELSPVKEAGAVSEGTNTDPDEEASQKVPEGDAVANCDGYGAGVDKKVIWFCRRYRGRFGGKILCRDCQSTWHAVMVELYVRSLWSCSTTVAPKEYYPGAASQLLAACPA